MPRVGYVSTIQRRAEQAPAAAPAAPSGGRGSPCARARLAHLLAAPASSVAPRKIGAAARRAARSGRAARASRARAPRGSAPCVPGEVEQVRPDPGRARRARRLDDRRPAARAGRRGPGGSAPSRRRVDPGLDELRQRAQALPRRRRPRLGRPPDLVVERRHRERHARRRVRRAASASTSTSRTISGPRVISAERVDAARPRPRCRRASAGSAPRPADTGRSRRRSRPARAPTTAARARVRAPRRRSP